MVSLKPTTGFIQEIKFYFLQIHSPPPRPQVFKKNVLNLTPEAFGFEEKMLVYPFDRLCVYTKALEEAFQAFHDMDIELSCKEKKKAFALGISCAGMAMF